MHFHGRIYATAQGIFFYSKLFGRERKLSLGYATIRSIQPPHGVLRSIIIHTGTTKSFSVDALYALDWIVAIFCGYP